MAESLKHVYHHFNIAKTLFWPNKCKLQENTGSIEVEKQPALGSGLCFWVGPTFILHIKIHICIMYLLIYNFLFCYDSTRVNKPKPIWLKTHIAAFIFRCV